MKRIPLLIEIRISGDSGEPAVQRLVAALRAFAGLDVSAEHTGASDGGGSGRPRAEPKGAARERILREAVEEARAADGDLGYAAGVAARKGVATTARALSAWIRHREIEPPRRHRLSQAQLERMRTRAAHTRAVRAARQALAKEAEALRRSTLETPP